MVYFFYDSFFVLYNSFFASSLTALSLKDKLVQGSVGDYIITEQNRLCSLIRIHTLTETKLIIEEVSFPEASLPKNTKEWLTSGAKGHTSWSLIEIDLTTTAVTSSFSFTKNAWLVWSADDSFLLKILDIPFSPILDQERRRIGPPIAEGPDTRKIWNPPLFFEGKKETLPQFSPFRLTYPKDGSLLSGKRIELFFNSGGGNFPFPYWGQITDASDAALKFRVIDSGRNLSSPKKSPI